MKHSRFPIISNSFLRFLVGSGCILIILLLIIGIFQNTNLFQSGVVYQGEYIGPSERYSQTRHYRTQPPSTDYVESLPSEKVDTLLCGNGAFGAFEYVEAPTYGIEADHLRLYCLSSEGVYEGEVWSEDARFVYRAKEKSGLYLGVDKAGQVGIEGFEVYRVNAETLEFTPMPKTMEIRAFVSALRIANFGKENWLRD